MLLRNINRWLKKDRASYHYKNAVFLLAWFALPLGSMAQQTYPLPVDGSSPQGEERVMERNGEKTITGVTQPSITVYRPEKSNGTAVILCAGGGMRALSWTNDVERMAKFFNEKGVTAIGLKYRLNTAPFGPGGGQMPALVDVTGHESFPKANANPMPGGAGDVAIDHAIEDARAAIRMVRGKSDEWGIDPAKVGYLGFSAGGGVAIGATVRATEEEMPNFLMTAYGPSLIDVDVPAQAPDLLIMTRAEHGNVAAGCLQLFLEWKKAKKNAELHMYGDGNGPFILTTPNGTNTTETWAESMIRWMSARRLLTL